MRPYKAKRRNVMTKWRYVLATAACLAAVPAFAADLSGTWTGTLTDPSGNEHPVTLALKVDGVNVTGAMTGGPPTGAKQPLANGKLNGDQLSYNISAAGPQGTPSMAYTCTVSGNKLACSNTSPMGTLQFDLTRKQ
jgi:hypothetical protein